MPPLQKMDEALAEIRWSKEHGACGVLKKGDREAGKYPADPYFEPLYAEAEKLDLPICIHTGSGIPDFSPAREFSHGQFMRTKGAAINGVLDIVPVAAQDPDLKRFVEGKLAERRRARGERDFAKADAIRDELVAAGIEIKDGPSGTSWKKIR